MLAGKSMNGIVYAVQKYPKAFFMDGYALTTRRNTKFAALKRLTIKHLAFQDTLLP